MSGNEHIEYYERPTTAYEWGHNAAIESKYTAHIGHQSESAVSKFFKKYGFIIFFVSVVIGLIIGLAVGYS